MSSVAASDALVGEVGPVTQGKPAGIVRTALRMWRTRIGAVIAGLVLIVAIIGPFVAPNGSEEYIETPYRRHVKGLFLGTDYSGYDVWSRFLHGGRSILILALFSTILGVGLGGLLGMGAAYLRGRLDEIVMRTLDVFLAFPQLLLSLIVIAMFKPSPLVIIMTIGLSTVPRVARVIRGAAIGIVERDFIGAAEAIGESRLRVLFSEVLPNVSSTILVEANLRFTYGIGLIASLSFLGFTPRLGIANWGLMIQENGSALTVQPWGVFLPTLAIALLTVGNGLVADGLSRAVAGVDRGKAEV
jgi:peptide/nickel transport system permease protein